MTRAEYVLHYWFHDLARLDEIVNDRIAFWFRRGEDVDREIRDAFHDDVKKAAAGEYDDWLKTDEGWLAFIVLIDQFTRNIYRNDGRSYELDPLGLKTALAGLEVKRERKLPVLARPFIFLPVMHAEDREMQRLSVELAEGLLREAVGPQREFCEMYLSSAQEHKDIIDQFGRYPHRNALLGRPSTPDEVKFLETSDFLKRV